MNKENEKKDRKKMIAQLINSHRHGFSHFEPWTPKDAHVHPKTRKITYVP